LGLLSGLLGAGALWAGAPLWVFFFLFVCPGLVWGRGGGGGGGGGGVLT